MFRLRIPLCLALLVASCGDGDLPPTGVAQSALNSCNDATDCPIPGLSGLCVGVQCVGHECQFITDGTRCATGCTVAATDCQVTGACNTVPCKPADGTHTNPWCDFNDYTTMPTRCACTQDTNCAPNVCQQNASCQNGTCTYAAKPPIAAPCCNVTADCGGTATCTSNVCGCTGGTKFCSGASAGGGRCVPAAGCCLDTDCPTGNSCQARTCSTAGACGFQSNGSPGCCNVAAADCGGTATCTNNTCTCAAGEVFCAGASAGGGSCISCPARANATVACAANACVYTCNAGFHDCNGVCKDNTSVSSCGTSCTACPANACQTATCTAGVCGVAAAGASPCCGAIADCVPANACQKATACTNNTCAFGSTGAAGCCNTPADCPTSSDVCLQSACVANQCATAPIAGCSDDGGTMPADDLAVAAPPDLSAAISLSGGGGCSFAGGLPRAPAAALLALLLVAFALRRRSA